MRSTAVATKSRITASAASADAAAAAAAAQAAAAWKSLVDNFIIEALASLFVNVTAVMYGHYGFQISEDNHAAGFFADPWGQFIPSVATGIIFLTCKDEHYVPPDASPTVTLLFWSLGVYETWMHAVVRLLGHLFAFTITYLLCKDMGLIPQALPILRPPGVVFGVELIATCLEHMAMVYLLLPLFPNSARNNQSLAHVSVAFIASHWCLRVGFAAEMNPSVSLLKTLLAVQQLPSSHAVASANATTAAAAHHGTHHTAAELWHEGLMMVWGQIIGLVICAAYAAGFSTHWRAPKL
jgi:hypothetical protein